MFSIRLLIVGVFALLLCCCGQSAFAVDNGVSKLELPDAAAVGMGGAYTGDAGRPSAVYYNPAGITQMDTAEVSAGITFLQPQIEYKPITGNSIEMNRDDYIFPNVYVTTPVYKDKLFVGLGENSNFGLGNDWSGKGPMSFTDLYMSKDSISNQDYMLVGAYKLNDQLSFGVGAIDDQSTVEDYKLIDQHDGTFANALFKADDNAWGYTLATMYKLNDQNQFGLTYKSPIQHTYTGDVYLQGMDTTLGLLQAFGGNTSATTKAVTKLTLPQSVTLGYSVKPINKLKINFDLEWTDWSHTKQLTTTFPNATPTQQGLLGFDNPTQPRDWTSVWAESIGAEYSLTDTFRVRGGYAHHQSPVPELNLDTEFFDSDSNAYTVGFGYDITKNLTIDIGYVAVFCVTRNIVNNVGAELNPLGDSVNLSGKYREFINIGTASLTYKF